MDLTEQKCTACEGGMLPLNKTESDMLLQQVSGWKISNDFKKIFKHFIFKNFTQALTFINQVGVISENEGHHPDLKLFDYKKVEIVLSTHAIDGLSVNDFIVAAKINEL